jgi:outer membrane murein-binding lipoprotein Lpp
MTPIEIISQLSAERDALASQANALEQEKDAALHRLQASEERERRLSERLASIAGLCAGN